MYYVNIREVKEKLNMPSYYSNSILKKELEKLDIFYTQSIYNYMILDEINYKKIMNL